MDRIMSDVSEASMGSAVMDPPKEGDLTKKVEQFTAQVPSLAYLGLALGSMLISGALASFTKRKAAANFIGLWVPTILLVGVYNKLVKLEESDRFSRAKMH